MTPPKPKSRAPKVSLWRYMRLFRQDILSAQPEKLYKSWMAEFKTPFFRSYMVNDPKVIDEVLKRRPDDFPKAERISEGLRPLLGQSVFLTNGDLWKSQRRIIDQAFEGGRLRETFPSIYAAAQSSVARLRPQAQGDAFDIEAETSHAAADVIFRTLFSIPIENQLATRVFWTFKEHQRTQPLLNLGAFIPLPSWMPRFFKRSTKRTAREIRELISQLVATRLTELEQGRAPNDLATKILTTKDPVSNQGFDHEQMVDQVAIFFLAGHETSASALAWALYLLARYPKWQEQVAAEAQDFKGDFSELSRLKVTRDVFKETLRLYPPVPMMVREAAQGEIFRDREIRKKSMIVLSPWHLHRHTRLWDSPDEFDPSRWQGESVKESARSAYMPFSAGPRVCTGAGFAMIEGVVMLAEIVKHYQLNVGGVPPVPVAHLTVRSKNGISIRLTPRCAPRVVDVPL